MPIYKGDRLVHPASSGSRPIAKVLKGERQVWPAPASAPPGRLWTPADMSALLYLDASVADSVVLSGNLITQWNDLADTTPTNATQGNGARQFTYDSANRLVVTGPQRTMLFSGALLSSLPDLCMFSLWSDIWSAAITSADGGCAIVTALDTSVQQNWSFDLLCAAAGGTPAGSLSSMMQVNNGADGTAITYGSVVPDNQFIFQALRWQGSLPAGEQVAMRLNGVPAPDIDQSTHPAIATTAPSLTTGRIASYFSDQNWTHRGGRIATIMLCRAAEFDANITKLEGWAAHNWSQQALLPADHPYKSTRPMADAAAAAFSASGQEAPLSRQQELAALRRREGGRFVANDPTTEINEAWVSGAPPVE